MLFVSQIESEGERSIIVIDCTKSSGTTALVERNEFHPEESS
jgi:hypothetical protein